MDDIFEDMVQDKETNKESGGNITSLGIENQTVNPRFEGGPHPQLHHLPSLKVTSS